MTEPYYQRKNPVITGNCGILRIRNEEVGAVLIAPADVTPKELASMFPDDTPSRRKGYKQSPDHIAKRIRSGAEHYSWIGDAVSDKGGRSRALRAMPDIGPCVDCGSEQSERHHVDGDPTNNAPGNIIPVCHSCHIQRHIRMPKFRAAALANLEKAKVARWAGRVDSSYRSGDSCPDCGHRLGVINVCRRNGYKFTYIGCRKARGGCGFPAGSIKEPEHD